MSYNLTFEQPCPTPFLGPSLAQVCSGSQFLVFMTIVDTFIRAKQSVSETCGRVRQTLHPNPSYDFIVIGSGPGGAAVASRLSEVDSWSVLLLEAGPDEPPGADVPSMSYRFLGSELDWNHRTSNEQNACLASSGSCRWPRGKNLGGTSVHHGMMYLRGNPQDYDNWAALGNDGWTWDEVLPYFLKSENNTEIQRVGNKYHATGGPLTVGRVSWQPQFSSDVLKATKELGYNVIEDLNGEVKSGFTVQQGTIREGVRASSATAFLRPIRNRQNLHIIMNATATKIIIKNDKAVGVQYSQDGQLRTINVNREVIVSGGAINSPQLLLLSGIGPKNHLQSVNVTVVKDLPGVGENIHNHVSYRLLWAIQESLDNQLNWGSLAEYLSFQTGPLATPGLSPLTAKLPSTYGTSDNPDLQIFFGGYQAACSPSGDITHSLGGNITINTAPTNIQPISRGTIRLASNDPLANPIIWGNYLSVDRDINVIVEGINISLSIMNTSTLAKYAPVLQGHPLPACSQNVFLSNDYWKCAIRQNTAPENHQAGSCKMGPASDPMAVVDSQLRVHGINNIRVADTSIMPQVTSGNTAAPATMIGERAADFIKQTWQPKNSVKFTWAGRLLEFLPQKIKECFIWKRRFFIW